MSSGAELLFSFEFDERAAYEVEQKGWLEQVSVGLPDGRVISVCFYDPVRLAQELDSEVKRGKPFFC